MRVLFVCMGNICRSPTAEGVMRALVAQRGLDGEIEIDSAGTGGWHAGEPPDPRATATAAARGVTLAGGARQVRQTDFDAFDLILALDSSNLRDLRRLAPDQDRQGKLHLLREYDPGSADAADLDVADPYYGAAGGFDEVYDQIHAACAGLLDEIAPS
jgi:low molecular weight protein-tyrosine phosphatase